MRKTYLLFCRLEALIIKSLSGITQEKVREERAFILTNIKETGQDGVKKLGLFLSDYQPPLRASHRHLKIRVQYSWCSVFDSVREHHGIPKGSTGKFLTLEEWVSWSRRLKIS